MVIPHALGYNSIRLYRVPFHSLLPSIQITNKRDMSEDIKRSSCHSSHSGREQCSCLHPAQSRQRCPVSRKTSLCSLSRDVPDTKSTNRFQSGPDRFMQGSALLTTKNDAPDSNFSCGHRRNTLLRCSSLAMVRARELG